MNASQDLNSAKPDQKADPNADNQARIKLQEMQIAELQNLYRTALADGENVRQRSKRELAEKHVFAIQKFAKDIIETADILKMALESVPAAERGDECSHPELKNLYVGVKMTQAELAKTLKRFGIEEFDPIGSKFDPNFHMALFQVKIVGKEEGTIVSVQKVGYMINDRVLRPAQVGVAEKAE